MRLLLAALCALSLASPAFAASAVTSGPPPRKVFNAAEAAREMARALKPLPAAKQKPAPKKAWKPAPRPVVARPIARPVVRRAARPTWRARRWASTPRWKRAAKAPSAAQLASRTPAEPPAPIWIGDLYIQADGVPMWSGPNGTQVARLTRATMVVNMGRYGGYYKVEAPNGTVGYVQAAHLGPSQPSW